MAIRHNECGRDARVTSFVRVPNKKQSALRTGVYRIAATGIIIVITQIRKTKDNEGNEKEKGRKENKCAMGLFS